MLKSQLAQSPFFGSLLAGTGGLYVVTMARRQSPAPGRLTLESRGAIWVGSALMDHASSY